MADPDPDQEDLLELWRPYRRYARVWYWIKTIQTVASQELNGDRFIWEAWDVDKVRKVGQSADGQTYRRRQYANQGAERFLTAFLAGG